MRRPLARVDPKSQRRRDDVRGASSAALEVVELVAAALRGQVRDAVDPAVLASRDDLVEHGERLERRQAFRARQCSLGRLRGGGV